MNTPISRVFLVSFGRTELFSLIVVALLGGATCSLAQSDAQPVNPLPMPAVTVTATNELSEEALMGPNQQPEWTARRRFALTRIYVQPPWQA
jgi:hypothetical protein